MLPNNSSWGALLGIYTDQGVYPLTTVTIGDSTLGTQESGGRAVVTYPISGILDLHTTAFDHAAYDTHIGITNGDPHGARAAHEAAFPHGTYDAHVASSANPHGVTAAQAGADPAGSAATVQSNLDTHAGLTNNPHSVTAAQLGAVTPSDNVTWTGEHVFTNKFGVQNIPIQILNASSQLMAEIRYDQANTALRIEVSAASPITQVLISKVGGAADIRADGEITHQDSSIPGDS